MVHKNALIFLNLLNLSPAKTKGIISSFKNLDDIFRVDDSLLRSIPLLGEADIERIRQLKESKSLDKELSLIEKNNIDCLGLFDEDYPVLLKEICTPPLVLYIKGDKAILKEFLFSVVGTRIPTIYGLASAHDLSYRLSMLGIIIVSGLARGIDTAAHKGALKANKTIAVLGSGLLNIYPRENKELAHAISNNGAVISEFGLLTPPLKENFPRRNRIVSGLSKGVLVVEAALRSGALITARLSCEQNRDVFAIPGDIDSPLSKGPHKLIKEGAKLVDSLEDILQELNIDIEAINENKKIKLNRYEKGIYEVINTRKGVSLEQALIKSNLNRDIFNTTMLELQLKGIIKEIRPNQYIRT